MQIGFRPRTNAAHRLACLSLYRAILKECANLKPCGTSATIQNSKPTKTTQALVRYRFERDRRFDNWQQIRNALQFGREALDLLKEANTGSYKALASLTDILSTTASFATRNANIFKQWKAEQSQRTLPRTFAERKIREAHQANKAHYKPKPDSVPVLNRPVPYEQALKDNDGRRRVPDYFVVMGVPFLRYTHHQPLSLTRYITDQIVKDQSIHHKARLNTETVEMAEREDKWDEELRKKHKIYQDNTQGYTGEYHSWTAVPLKQQREHNAKISKFHEAQADMSQKMLKVYVEEKELAQIESAARKEERRKQRQLQKSDVPAQRGGSQDCTESVPLEATGRTRKQPAKDRRDNDKSQLRKVEWKPALP